MADAEKRKKVPTGYYRPEMMGPWIPSKNLTIDERVERAQMQRFVNKANKYLRQFHPEKSFGMQKKLESEPTVGFIVSERPRHARMVVPRPKQFGMRLHTDKADQIAHRVLGDDPAPNGFPTDANIVQYKADAKVLTSLLTDCQSTRHSTIEEEVLTCLMDKGLKKVHHGRMVARSRANSAASSRVSSRKNSPRQLRQTH